MKRRSALIAALGLVLALPAAGLAQDKALSGSDRISMAEFKKAFTSGSLAIIDVRDLGAYEAGHIPGALSMPLSSIDAGAGAKLKSLGKTVVTYCA